MFNLEEEWAKGCNAPCSHGGICSLDWDHAKDHSAGHCSWPRSDSDHHETLEEGLEWFARVMK